MMKFRQHCYCYSCRHQKQHTIHPPPSPVTAQSNSRPICPPAQRLATPPKMEPTVPHSHLVMRLRRSARGSCVVVPGRRPLEGAAGHSGGGERTGRRRAGASSYVPGLGIPGMRKLETRAGRTAEDGRRYPTGRALMRPAWQSRVVRTGSPGLKGKVHRARYKGQG